ncbi:MAG: hypothetical protein ABFS10_14620 [Bacteroidota bacterium]
MNRYRSLPSLALWFTLAVMLVTIVTHHHWTRDDGPNRGVIHWDIISYYSYLPATFIHGDVTLGFLDDKEFNNDNKFWPTRLENGNRLILTSMGLSILYSPFFFMAHGLAPLFNKAPDGFSSIYQLFLVLSSLFYVMMGLLLLRRLLLKYFTPLTTALTLLLVGLGTNLFFYTVHEGPMSHGYSFALITLFLTLVIKWYSQPTYRTSIWIGLVYGMIVLVRPSNIIVGILFLGWGVTGMKLVGQRGGLLLKQYRHLLLMMVLFIVPWIPQMVYWKVVTGSLLFNSYGPSGSSFYFGSPHIFDVLFSFRKGWYLYTPVMMVATAGLYFLGKRHREMVWPITLYLVVEIYLLASWWSWWNGGSFGLRSFVDLYGVMALPLAALVEVALKARKQIKVATVAFLFFLLYMNQYQTHQYTKGYIHHTGMTREAYFLNFLSFRPDGKSWHMLSMPDAELARLGIYYNYYTGDDHTLLKEMDRAEGLEKVGRELDHNHPKIRKEISRHARRTEITYEEALQMVVERVYEQKSSQ